MLLIVILQIDFQTYSECSSWCYTTGVDTLVEHSIGCRHLGIATQILGDGEEVVCLYPNLKSLEP